MRQELDQLSRRIENEVAEIKKIRDLALLDNYRTFRHLARNIYTFNLDSRRLHKLVDNLPDTVEKVCQDISAFLDFLKEWSINKG